MCIRDSLRPAPQQLARVGSPRRKCPRLRLGYAAERRAAAVGLGGFLVTAGQPPVALLVDLEQFHFEGRRAQRERPAVVRRLRGAGTDAPPQVLEQTLADRGGAADVDQVAVLPERVQAG